MKRRQRNTLLASLAVALSVLGVLVGYDQYNIRRTTLYVPMPLSDGTVIIQKLSEPSIFASLTKIIFHASDTQRYLQYFDVGEQPAIELTQPNDAIAFFCPAGTSIKAIEMFSAYSTNPAALRYAYKYTKRNGLWEADYLDADPSTDRTQVFPWTNFGGNAGSSYPNISPDTVFTFTDSQNLLFATSQVAETMRCSVVCGDGIVDASNNETCDDGNQINTDGCFNNCTLPVQPAAQPPPPPPPPPPAPQCGNGILESGEVCDNGASNNWLATCLPTCTTNTCGDGYVNKDVVNNQQVEQCDDYYTCTAHTVMPGVVINNYLCDPTKANGQGAGQNGCDASAQCTRHTADGCDNSCARELYHACRLVAHPTGVPASTPVTSTCEFGAPGADATTSSYSTSVPPGQDPIPPSSSSSTASQSSLPENNGV